MAYDITGHPLLTGKAARLGSPEPLGEYTRLAEDLLGLAGTSYTDTSLAKAQRALALQVSFWVARDVMPDYLASQTRGSRSESYKDPLKYILPAAQALVDQLLASAGILATPIRSLRPYSCEQAGTEKDQREQASPWLEPGR